MNPKENLKEKIELIQRQLSISENHSEKRLLPIIENLQPRVFSENGYDFFLIPILTEIKDEQERLEGLFISITNNILGNDPEKTFLQIKTTSSRREIFTPFIAELISKDLSEPINALEETLKEWRDFWSGKRGQLSKFEQRGLLGELIVLNALIECVGTGIIEKWGGPLDWLHDFESEKLHLEVKTTSKQPASVYISKISQVAPMEGDTELQLIVVGLEEGDEISLPKMISSMRNTLSGSEKMSKLEKILSHSGYRDTDALFYQKEYGVSFVKSHKITKDSPVLNPKILGDIPSTVTNIRYILQVHAMEMEDIDSKKWSKLAEKL